MKKELLIIVYKINIAGLSPQSADSLISNFIENCKLRFDDELKEDYIIREIYIPIQNGDTDVQIIYPLALSGDSYKLIKDINNKIENDMIDEETKIYWKKLLRELKIKSLNCEE